MSRAVQAPMGLDGRTLPRSGRGRGLAAACVLVLDVFNRRVLLGKPVREAQPEIEGQGYFELLDSVYATGEPFTGREWRIEVAGHDELARLALTFNGMLATLEESEAARRRLEQVLVLPVQNAVDRQTDATQDVQVAAVVDREVDAAGLDRAEVRQRQEQAPTVLGREQVRLKRQSSLLATTYAPRALTEAFDLSLSRTDTSRIPTGPAGTG